jgi:hypothetical protein
VKASFNRQGLMKALNGRLTRIDAGCVHIELPYSEVVTLQHGYVHAAASRRSPTTPAATPL